MTRSPRSSLRHLLRRAVLPVALVAFAGATTACRSPFADWEESGPAEDPQKVGAGVHGWPFYERDPNRAGVRTDVLWPLSSVRTSPDGDLRRADLLVPIVLIEKDGTRSRFGVRPLFDVETDSDPAARVEDVDILFPLVKWRETAKESRFEVRPLSWSGHDGEETWTVFVPFGGAWDLERGHGWFAGPFAGSTTTGTDTTDWYAAGMWMHQTDPEKSLEGTKAVLGLFENTTWDDGFRWRLFPFVTRAADTSEAEESTLLVWPGLGGWARDGDTRTEWAAPVWFHQKDDDDEWTVAFPLWFSYDGRDSRTRVLFPIYGSQTDGDLERTFWGGNLLITTTSPKESAVDVVWPIVHHGTDETGWDARIFPVLWLDRHPDHSTTHLWPLFGTHTSGSHTETSVAWPFFTVDTYEGGWKASLPAPFITLDRMGADRETSVWPLFDHEWDEKDGSYEGDLLWIVSNWERTKDGKSDFRILWRLVQDTDTGDRRTFAVNPFFRHETNTRGDDHWSALFGLVGRTREADDVTWRLFWFLTL